jgi:hypothetical protein
VFTYIYKGRKLNLLKAFQEWGGENKGEWWKDEFK